MDVAELRAFVAVAETGTATAAAARLHLSQSALSERIKRLEREVGARLFDRDARGMTLTTAGEAYLPYAHRALAELDRGRQTVQARGRRRPTLRVDVHDPALAVPRAFLRQLRAARPEADVEVSGRGAPDQTAALRDGSLDLALGVFAPSPPGLEQVPWETEPLVLALAGGHRLAADTSIGRDALADEVHYLPRESFAPEWNALVRDVVGPRIREVGVHADTVDAPLELVAAGECVAVGLASTPVPEGVTTRPLSPPATCTWALRGPLGWPREHRWMEPPSGPRRM